MMAAYAAAESGHAVTLLEQNEKLGKKLFITGKGRCNLTNASDMEQLFANVVSNRKFLYSAFYSYDNEQVISFFESHGMPTKTERGNRVFPVSDHSSDVIAALSTALRGQHVEVLLHTKVKRLLLEKRDEEKRVTGVELADHTKMHADAVIVATGGISYPSTGATGDGYRMAEESGHKMVSPTPALVPMEMKNRGSGICRAFRCAMSVCRLPGERKNCMRILERCFLRISASAVRWFCRQADVSRQKHLTRSFP